MALDDPATIENTSWEKDGKGNLVYNHPTAGNVAIALGADGRIIPGADTLWVVQGIYRYARDLRRK